MPIKSVEVFVNSRTQSVEVGGGLPGPIGVSITGAVVNGSGHLILTMSTGATIDSGYVIGPPGPIASITETGNGIIIDVTSPTSPVLSLDPTLEAIANFATGANKVMVWSGTDTLTSFDVDTDVTLAANSDTKFATQKAIKAYVDALIAAQDAMVFKGVIDASTNPNYPAGDRGHTWRISVAGKIGGVSGVNVESGDLIICLTDGTAAGTQAAVGANWTISQTNLDGAVIGPASSTDASVAGFSGTSGKLIKVLTATEIRVAAVLATSDSPQFAGLNIGHATDTTVGRTSAGVINVEGVDILLTTLQQDVSNKDLTDSSVNIVDAIDRTKKVQIAADLVPTATTNVLTAPPASGVILTDPTAVTSVLPTLDFRFTNFEGALFDDYFSRSGVGGYRQNAKGVLVPTVDREPVIDFSAGTALGTYFGGSATNQIRNNSMQGGGAGVSPTNWAGFGATTNGVTPAVVGVGSENGMDYIDISVTGTCSASGAFRINIESNSQIAAAQNQIWTHSAFFKLVSGAMQSSVIQVEIREFASGSASGGAAQVAATVGTSIVRTLNTRTLTDASATHAQPNLRITIINGETYNYVFRLYWPQMERNGYASPPLRTTTVAVVRNAEIMIDTDISEWFNSIEGTVYLEGAVVGEPTSTQNLFLLSDGTSNNRIVIRQGLSLTGVDLLVTSGGVDQVNTPSATTIRQGNSFKIAVKFKLNDFELCVAGSSIATDTSGTVPSGINQFQISGGSFYLRRLIYWPKALSATELQRMTA